MTNETTRRNAQLLRGRIRNLSKTRCSRDFVFTESDRRNMGATVLAAGLTGLGGVAAGLGATAMDTTEAADLLEFELDGKPVKAWIWISIFTEGDEVEVVAVAEPDGDGWVGYGIRRISDRIVALYPHCSRGRYAHYKASFSWCIKLGGGLLVASSMLGAVVAFTKSLPSVDIIPFVLLCLASNIFVGLVFAAIAYRISRRFMGFVHLAERIFQIFGWSDVKNIDLPAITRKSKRPGDPGPLGVLYFRY